MSQGVKMTKRQVIKRANDEFRSFFNKEFSCFVSQREDCTNLVPRVFSYVSSSPKLISVDVDKEGMISLKIAINGRDLMFRLLRQIPQNDQNTNQDFVLVYKKSSKFSSLIYELLEFLRITLLVDKGIEIENWDQIPA